jgi:acyl carrier protein
MGDAEIWKRLRALVSYYSGAPEASLDATSSPRTTTGWDSVANLGIMSAIEDEFAVTVATRDVLRLRTLADIADYVKANGKPSESAGSPSSS